MSNYIASSSAASSCTAWKYDVFLSFRGEDTRRNFVSHLYDALQQKGIHVFKDDERLETGKSISYELLKAIEESKIAVVIFSKNYASSKWCLEELAHIIKCKSELDQILIPIFYDVNPSDVHHQNPPFAKSFSKHEKRCIDDMEKVLRWRGAFAEAGKLSGYHLQNFKDEAECIKKVVDNIFPKSLQVSSSFPEGLVGMKTQVEKVISLLDMESDDDVRFVGIWGMGGIGKTEIANVIYERYRHGFEADCFLGDVGEMCLKNRPIWLQQALIRKLLGKKVILTSEREGGLIIENKLRQKKVLVILDDVNHREQLELLVGGPEWFGKGSRIIVTARDKHLLISHVGDNVYEVQLLTESEALELFSRHAFREKSPREDFMELSRQVVQYAGGLPLALKVLGSSFYKRDKEQWRGIIDRLKKIPRNDILGKLRISFDGLDKDEKEIFLDITCFYKNYLEYYYVKLVLQSRGIHLIGIDYLVEKSLLSIDRANRIVMHNMIREMGENIIREEYKNSRIWLPEEVHDLFSGKLKKEKVESLWIQSSYGFEDDLVNLSKVFKRMRCLQVLRIDVGTLSSDCTVTYLPSSLRFIDWREYPSSSLPESFEPSQLAVLILFKSRLVELYSISKKLSSLKHLSLSCSLELTKTPNFGEMPNLETLDLSGCENLEEVHPSLGHCRKLKELNLRQCTKLKKLPKFVSMESLVTLYLEDSPSLKKFPKICGVMRRFSGLSVGSPWIQSLPPSLSSLTHLDLECESLESIPDAVIQNLIYLRITRCNKLSTLPRSLGGQNKLVELEVHECENFKKLPNSFQVESLESLIICDCPKFTFSEINGDMHRLPKLARAPTGITELPFSIGYLSGLTDLFLTGCEDLVSLPNSLCNLKNLRWLCLHRCKKLEKLPENIGDLQQLENLDARETAMSQPVPLSFKNLGKLVNLEFSSFVLRQVSGLSSLKYLHLTNCNIMGGLPEDLICLSSLEHLNLCNSNILGGLPEDIGLLHSLRNLNVSGSNISYLPKSISKLLCLTSLNVQFCKSLGELPGELPPNLVSLYADDHLALKSIRDLLIKCVKLKEMSFSENTECKPASSNQNLLKFLGHFLRTFIQCHFHQREYVHISFPIGERIPESYGCEFSINLNPSWYTDKFLGFFICCRINGRQHDLSTKLTCELSDPERKHPLRYSIRAYQFPCSPSFLSIIYIPFETLWRYSLSKERKNPNDYCLFEVSTSQIATSWRIYLEYENEAEKWRRMQQATQSLELFSIQQLDNTVTTENVSSMVYEQLEPSHASAHLQAYEQNIAMDMGLHLGYEIEDLEVDLSTTAVQKEHETHNVDDSIKGSKKRKTTSKLY